MALLQSRGRQLDASLILKASAAVTSSAAGTLILDLAPGDKPSPSDGDAEVWNGQAIINVTAMDIVSNDEAYTIVIQGSPDAAFGTAGNIKDLVQYHLGAKEIKLTDSDMDDAIGKHTINFSNYQNGVVYRYVRIYTVVAGTTPSITYSAYASPFPPSN